MFCSMSWRASTLRSLTLMGAFQSWTAADASMLNCSFMDPTLKKDMVVAQRQDRGSGGELGSSTPKSRLDTRFAGRMPFHPQLAGLPEVHSRKAPPLLGSPIYYADSIIFLYC